MAHKIADRVKETSSTTGTGAITLLGAVSGFQSFAFLSNNDTTDYTVLDANGTAWECNKDAVYTSATPSLSRVFSSSSTGSAISLSAGTHTVFCGLLAAEAQQLLTATNIVTGTDAATTMVANTTYIVAMSGWATADRNYTCPASPAVGDRVSIVIQSGNASFELIVKGNTSQTINGGSAASEWSRLMMTGECVELRYVASNTWIVSYDGRIPIKVLASRSAVSLVQNTALRPAWDTTTIDNSSGFNNGGTYVYYALRRAGVFTCDTELLTSTLASGAVGMYADIISDPNGSVVYYGQDTRFYKDDTVGGVRLSAQRNIAISVPTDTKVTAEFTCDGATGNIAGADLSIIEQLP